MNLTTPDKIRNLQRKLYCKAKAEPTFRFYLLYDKICREDILLHAYRLARVNAGAPGVDGMTFAQIEKQGLEAWLAGLRMELVSKTYRPDPVRRAMIPKANGGERPLGIPTIRDRVIQTAAKIVIEPIFEADFEDNAYGYRPARGAVDAVKEVHRHLCRGYADVVDADLSFLARRHKVQGRGNRRFTFDVIHRELGVLCLSTPAQSGPVACIAVKPVGKPDAGNRHVRFDERGWETGRWPKAPSYRAHPRLYQFGPPELTHTYGRRATGRRLGQIGSLAITAHSPQQSARLLPFPPAWLALAVRRTLWRSSGFKDDWRRSWLLTWSATPR